MTATATETEEDAPSALIEIDEDQGTVKVVDKEGKQIEVDIEDLPDDVVDEIVEKKVIEELTEEEYQELKSFKEE